MSKINFKLILNFSYAVALSMMVIILSINFTAAFKPIYYTNINSLKINNFTSLSKAKIKKSYSYIVDFLFENKSSFSIPYFKSSPKGRAHFYEVKLIFKKIDTLFYFLYGALFILSLLQYQNIDIHILKYSSQMLLSTAISLIFAFEINFDNFFTLFHKVLFNNDNWIFYPSEDEVINILPQKFFLICAAFILSLMIVTCIIFYALYRKLQKNIEFCSFDAPHMKFGRSCKKKIFVFLIIIFV